MNEWSHLPNARHIDWVLESVKQHPKIWASAAREATWEVVWEVALEVAWDAARGVTYAAARGAAWAASWAAALEAARGAARDASWAAILALIGYDDCANLFDMPGEQLKTWALLTEKPAAVLLLPAVIARERIRGLECVKA